MDILPPTTNDCLSHRRFGGSAGIGGSDMKTGVHSGRTKPEGIYK